jgi:transglutaminase-like putative cysteine protease
MHMKRCRLFALPVAAAAALLAPAPGPLGAEEPVGLGPAAATFRVKHALTVKDIPADAQKVRVWFWFPGDDECQRVRDVGVTAPGPFEVTRDKDSGHRYLYAAVAKPGTTVSLATEFLVQRREAAVKLDPDQAGPLTDSHRAVFAEHLRKDCPGMEVTAEMTRLARTVCGDEANVVRQARALGAWVIANTEHYSKPGAPKSSGQGSAEYCLANKGGGCTDQHALFIALARARGIPTRLHFGSVLREKNEGKDHDPGYRCWVQYFVPNYGWVSADLSEADVRGRADYDVSSMDERHIRFAEGRDLRLTPAQDGPPVNLFLVAHVEVDGRPHPSFDRVLRFQRVR